MTCNIKHKYIFFSLFLHSNLSGLGGWYSYRMSKAALNMATRNLSIELGRSRPKVSVLHANLTCAFHFIPGNDQYPPSANVSHGQPGSLAIVGRCIPTYCCYLFWCFQVLCVSLHPGTVNTNLSRPYHKNVPKDKLFSAEHSVHCLMNIINSLSIEKTGKAYNWDGNELPW